MRDPAPEAVQRLALVRNGEEGFLQPHHLETAVRLSHLFEKAHLRQRVTMSYDSARSGGQRGAARGPTEIADSAADARQRLHALARVTGRDCWDVLTDVCAFDRGLQEIELARQWPRRSAKLVLRIGLDQASLAFGFSAVAHGGERSPVTAWLETRLPMFPDDPN